MKATGSAPSAALLLGAILACSGCSPPPEKPAKSGPAVVECDLDDGPCTARAGGLDIVFEILPRPVRTMTDLTVTVTAAGDGGAVDDEAVGVEFTMPGMVMATGRFVLDRTGEGEYRGTAVIVRCPSGGRCWRATVFGPSIPHTAFDFTVDGE